MRKITEKKEFGISPQKRGTDSNLLVATPTNTEDVYKALIENIEPPKSSFFRNYVDDYVADRETLQELYSISDRTYQYWANDASLKPRINHHAVILLSLGIHPNLKVVKR